MLEGSLPCQVLWDTQQRSHVLGCRIATTSSFLWKDFSIRRPQLQCGWENSGMAAPRGAQGAATTRTPRFGPTEQSVNSSMDEQLSKKKFSPGLKVRRRAAAFPPACCVSQLLLQQAGGCTAQAKRCTRTQCELELRHSEPFLSLEVNRIHQHFIASALQKWRPQAKCFCPLPSCNTNDFGAIESQFQPVIFHCKDRIQPVMFLITKYQ